MSRPKSKKKQVWILSLVSLIILALLTRKYVYDYLVLKNNNSWTSGVIYRMSEGGKSTDYVYYKFSVDDKLFMSRKSVFTFDGLVLDSMSYIVTYNPENPNLSVLLLDLPTVTTGLGADLDSLKKKYNRELNFWKDF